MIRQLLTVDFNTRFDFDKVLKHVWFEKDILMKQKVNDLISEFSNSIKSKNPSFNKENVTKKIRFCPCFTQATTSNSRCI